MLFTGNKSCHPDLVLGCSEWIFGRCEASLKIVAASLSFTLWQEIDTYIGCLSFFWGNVISFFLLPPQSREIFKALSGRKDDEGIR